MNEATYIESKRDIITDGIVKVIWGYENEASIVSRSKLSSFLQSKKEYEHYYGLCISHHEKATSLNVIKKNVLNEYECTWSHDEYPAITLPSDPILLRDLAKLFLALAENLEKE